MARCKHGLLMVLATGSLLWSSLYFWIFYSEYWVYRNLFDENGRYFDAANTVVHKSEAAFYLAPAFLLLLVGSWLLRRANPCFSEKEGSAQ